MLQYLFLTYVFLFSVSKGKPPLSSRGDKVSTVTSNSPSSVNAHNWSDQFAQCIAFEADALQVIKATYFGRKLPENNNDQTVLMEGVITSNDVSKLTEQFIKAIILHRFWDREKARKVPA